jgi:hypothetical protein
MSQSDRAEFVEVRVDVPFRPGEVFVEACIDVPI